MHRSPLCLWFASLLLLSLLFQPAAAQAPRQPLPVASPAGVAPAQPTNPFIIPAAEQAWLDQVLNKWEVDSATVQNFYTDFERDIHNQFGPGGELPYKKEQGKLGYTRPDKGSIQIVESLVWTAKPQPAPAPGAPPVRVQGDWVKQQGEVPGDHWVCDGKQVYEYRPIDKELVVKPIPVEMQGKNIIDGPLPFLFGAEAEKLKQRYWIRPAKELCSEKFIGLHAKPKFQKDAANSSDIWIVLRNEPKKPLMPAGLRIRHPNGSWDEYRFTLEKAQVNGRLAAFLEPLFRTPRTPFGWQKVVEPMQQAPVQAQRPSGTIQN